MDRTSLTKSEFAEPRRAHRTFRNFEEIRVVHDVSKVHPSTLVTEIEYLVSRFFSRSCDPSRFSNLVPGSIRSCGCQNGSIMNDRSRTTAASLITLMLVASTTACTGVTDSGPVYSAPTCSQLLTTTINYARSGTGDIDSMLQSLTDSCSDEYEIAVDYLSNSIDGDFRVESCDELLGYGVRAEAVTLLEQDRLCTFGAGERAAVPEWPEEGLGWDEARERVGTVQRVCGPLMSDRETVDGTFLNVGRDYPSVDRFTFVFWDIHLESIALGTTVCGSGEIYLYEGVAQMEMQAPDAIELWNQQG